MKNLYQLIIVFFSLLGAASCSTLRTVTPPPAVILPTIKSGDKVALMLADGKEVKRLKVMTIDSGSIRGTCQISKKQRRDTTLTIQVPEIKGIAKRNHLYVVKAESIIRVTLKSGEVVKRMRVVRLDEEKITGIVRIQDANHKFVDSPRVIKKSEVDTIRVRVPDHAGTAALLGGTLIVGLVIVVVALQPFPGGLY
jgi:hypothetical protein